MQLHNLPTRAATGAFILHSGIEKWRGSEDVAAGVHGMAAGTYPFLSKVSAATFLKALSVGEVAVGTALLTPIVPPVVAGAALTAFSTGLLGLYLKTPGLRREGSIWPTQAGTAVSKDVWMLGVGLGLLFQGRRRQTL
jgi:hypothetical protein